MLTAESFRKINRDVNHIPVSERKKENPREYNISPESLDSVLKVLKAHTGFISTKTVIFKSGLCQTTTTNVIKYLRKKSLITEKTVNEGKATPKYLKLKKDSK